MPSICKETKKTQTKKPFRFPIITFCSGEKSSIFPLLEEPV